MVIIRYRCNLLFIQFLTPIRKLTIQSTLKQEGPVKIGFVSPMI